MRTVALWMQHTPFVLKGGTALALLYGLDRHSVDLDFDVGSAKRVSIKRYVRAGMQDANVPMSAFRRGRPMWRGRRYRIHYTNPDSGKNQVLTVELSSRKRPRPEDVVVVDGIRTYRITALFDQKMIAAADRTKGRDLFDLGFLAESYGDSLSNEQILRADEFSRDHQGLADRYRQAFQDGERLGDVATTDDRALAFRIAVVEQMHRRGQKIFEQAVPKSRSLADDLALHRIWLESDGQQGCRADLSDRRFVGSVLCGVNFERADLRRADFTGADLRNANLRSADLSEAVFDRTDLQGADFSGADLKDLSLRSSTLGPTTRGLAEALARVVKPGQPRYTPRPQAPRRAEPERKFGPFR
ncbi:MAG: nucleotidyl transferase AbiEii/AbiGii toxin family protein [Bryobacterales bacterium]|nr:nucleotidyl transferase AbiEii/AbiGii toxin family protein [Bryobacterales bacterium]